MCMKRSVKASSEVQECATVLIHIMFLFGILVNMNKKTPKKDTSVWIIFFLNTEYSMTFEMTSDFPHPNNFISLQKCQHIQDFPVIYFKIFSNKIHTFFF